MKKMHLVIKYSYIGISLAIVWVISFYVHSLAQGRYEDYKLQVEEILEIAMKREIDKRDTHSFPASVKLHGSNTYEELPSDTIIRIGIGTGGGEISYLVPAYKLHHNIADNGITSSFHSASLVKNPIDAEIFYTTWHTLMLNYANCQKDQWLRVSYTDWNNNRIGFCFPDSVLPLQADSICSVYVGNRGELEATVFANLSWYHFLTALEWLISIGIWAIVLVPILFKKSLNRFYNRYLTREKVIEKVVTIEKEKIIPMKQLEISIKNYHLGKGIFFDATNHKLQTPQKDIVLKTQIAFSLQCILDAEKYSIDKQELTQKLWPEAQDTDLSNRLYNVIYNLRVILKTHTPFDIISQKNCYCFVER